MHNLPYSILDGSSIRTSPPKEGRRMKILCVGLGYSRQLRSQWLSTDSPIESALVNVTPPSAMVLPALNDFTYPSLINDEVTNYSASVKRDFLRCLFLENLSSPCDIHSVTVCSDDVRDAHDLSKFEMNVSVSSRQFLPNLMKHGWKFDHIYVDHYRMHGPYIENCFGPQFFINLKHIARNGVLFANAKTASGMAQIYLPFCPHFFVNVISSNLNEEYDISYLEENDISIHNHRLHVATESPEHIEMSNYFEIRMEDQERFITTTEREIRQYRENELETTDCVSQKISDTNGEIEKIRYICFSLKSKIDDTFSHYIESKLIIENNHMDSSSIMCYTNNNDFKSKHVLLP